MKYYLYHIKGKKIGVTSNPEKRIHKQQGYKPGEYEIVLETTDIDHVSRLEIELQKKYNYKVDQQLYKNLKNKNDMKVNVTEQTTTFDVPVSKLKGRLMDIMGLSWETHLGEFELTIDKIPWIMKNTTASMYNNNRCFIYNKAFYEEFYANKTTEYHELNVYDLIRDWATEKGIYKSGDYKTQFVKLQEEAGELAKALLKDDQVEVIDAIGDMVVVLTNLAHLRNLTIEECISSAYDVIKNRTGNMVNGTFQKD
jgi:NTP pyrophosphatase (non-canonical NTP hydrolase)